MTVKGAASKREVETNKYVLCAALEIYFVYCASAAVVLPRGSFSKAVVYLEAAASSKSETCGLK